MPNKPRANNPHRSVRVEDDLWEAAKIAAAAENTTRGDIMRQALRELVARHDLARDTTTATHPQDR